MSLDWSVLNYFKLTEDEKNITKKMSRQDMIDELRQDVYGGVKKEELDDYDLLWCMLEENFTYLCEWERD